MDEKYNQVKELLEKYGQEQLLEQYERLYDKVEREDYLDSILAIDFKQLKDLYEHSEQKPIFAESRIEPIDFVEKDALSKEEYEKYETLGIDAIKAGKLAVVTMAGGQGTRLGHSGPKGTYDIGLASHKSIFEILTDTMKKESKKYGIDIPWYIMTSEENDAVTKSFFERHDYFGYNPKAISFFVQGKLPMVNTDGKILVGSDGKIKLASDGHGGVFQSLKKDGVLFDMKERGIEWVFIGGVDNVLVKPADPILIGLAISKGDLAAGKSLIKRDPYEKVGVFCKREGRPSVIEYSEISPEMSEARLENGELRYAESHILCNLFNMKAIESISGMKLPYHIAFKKAEYLDKDGVVVVPDKPNAYKFEAFLFDAFENLDDIAILRVKREEEFAPVKNAEGEDSPETAKAMYEAFHGGINV